MSFRKLKLVEKSINEPENESLSRSPVKIFFYQSKQLQRPAWTKPLPTEGRRAYRMPTPDCHDFASNKRESYNQRNKQCPYRQTGPAPDPNFCQNSIVSARYAIHPTVYSYPRTPLLSALSTPVMSHPYLKSIEDLPYHNRQPNLPPPAAPVVSSSSASGKDHVLHPEAHVDKTCSENIVEAQQPQPPNQPPPKKPPPPPVLSNATIPLPLPVNLTNMLDALEKKANYYSEISDCDFDTYWKSWEIYELEINAMKLAKARRLSKAAAEAQAEADRVKREAANLAQAQDYANSTNDLALLQYTQAKPSPPPPVPTRRPVPPKNKPNYLKAMTDDGRVYYYHKETLHSVWRLPENESCDDSASASGPDSRSRSSEVIDHPDPDSTRIVESEQASVNFNVEMEAESSKSNSGHRYELNSGMETPNSPLLGAVETPRATPLTSGNRGFITTESSKSNSGHRHELNSGLETPYSPVRGAAETPRATPLTSGNRGFITTESQSSKSNSGHRHELNSGLETPYSPVLGAAETPRATPLTSGNRGFITTKNELLDTPRPERSHDHAHSGKTKHERSQHCPDEVVQCIYEVVCNYTKSDPRATHDKRKWITHRISRKVYRDIEGLTHRSLKTQKRKASEWALKILDQKCGKSSTKNFHALWKEYYGTY